MFLSRKDSAQWTRHFGDNEVDLDNRICCILNLRRDVCLYRLIQIDQSIFEVLARPTQFVDPSPEGRRLVKSVDRKCANRSRLFEPIHRLAKYLIVDK
ncbi:MAG: hypothetical protein AAF561_15325 [Planctomycetota bacterium]